MGSPRPRARASRAPRRRPRAAARCMPVQRGCTHASTLVPTARAPPRSEGEDDDDISEDLDAAMRSLQALTSGKVRRNPRCTRVCSLRTRGRPALLAARCFWPSNPPLPHAGWALCRGRAAQAADRAAGHRHAAARGDRRLHTVRARCALAAACVAAAPRCVGSVRLGAHGTQAHGTRGANGHAPMRAATFASRRASAAPPRRSRRSGTRQRPRGASAGWPRACPTCTCATGCGGRAWGAYGARAAAAGAAP